MWLLRGDDRDDHCYVSLSYELQCLYIFSTMSEDFESAATSTHTCTLAKGRTGPEASQCMSLMCLLNHCHIWQQTYFGFLKLKVKRF